MNLLRPPPARGGKVVYFLCLLFILCVACITATHYMRSSSHDVFRFGCGETLREGLEGCEPKDIILLGDEMATDPIMSGIEENKTILTRLKNDDAIMLTSAILELSMLFKGASTMRSKPDEQMIRHMMAEFARKKNIDCDMMIQLSSTIDNTTALSVAQKDTLKKYMTKMINMGKCIGACK
jgi:hypothetical protein